MCAPSWSLVTSKTTSSKKLAAITPPTYGKLVTTYEHGSSTFTDRQTDRQQITERQTVITFVATVRAACQPIEVSAC